MKKAEPITTVPLDWIKLPEGIQQWEPYETDDIIADSLITMPNDYLLTLGSAGNYSIEKGPMASLATAPAYPLPTNSQFYVAGRDVVRWGGKHDPLEIDFDRYIFTPIPEKNIALVAKAPKSEPHHLSDVPELIEKVPDSWKEIFEAVKRGDFA